MSLKVWLPLNNDFKNVGLEQNFQNPSYNNLVINNEGPFTKCHKGISIFHFQNDFLNTNNWSISIWFNKPTSYPTNANAILLCKNTKTSEDCQFYLSVVYGTRLNIGLKTSSSLTYPSTFEINKWYHAAATYDGETLKLYFNGELVNSRKISYSLVSTLNFGIGGRATNEGGTSATGNDFLMNDVRVYDNCITNNDVKRMYQQKMFELVPYSGAEDVLFDRSGFMNMPLVNSNAVFQNNALYFNGTNAMLRPKNGNVGFTMDDGTLSVWFSISTAPTGYQMLYIDSVSKFAIGFLNSGSFIVTCNNSAMPTFSASHVKYDGSINSIIVSYNTSKTPQFCLINGIQEANVATNNWTETSGLTIGSRMYNTANSNFKGKIFKVGVYNRQFTQDEAVKLYNSERGMFLPDDYIQLEYIQGDKQAYIDTNFVLNSYCSAEAKFCFISAEGSSTGNFIMGCRKSYGNLAFNLVGYSGGVKWASNYGSATGDFGNSDTNIHILKRIKEKVYLDGDLKITTQQSSFTTPGNAYIFSCNQNGTPYLTSNIKLWYLKIWENDLLVRNFIPCKRKSDNVIGMYDMVSRQFFTNSGTGSFTGA